MSELGIDPAFVCLALAVGITVLALIVCFLPCRVCKEREKQDRA